MLTVSVVLDSLLAHRTAAIRPDADKSSAAVDADSIRTVDTNSYFYVGRVLLEIGASDGSADWCSRR